MHRKIPTGFIHDGQVILMVREGESTHNTREKLWKTLSNSLSAHCIEPVRSVYKREADYLKLKKINATSADHVASLTTYIEKLTADVNGNFLNLIIFLFSKLLKKILTQMQNISFLSFSYFGLV